MSTYDELNERLQKYSIVELFRILDENGKPHNNVVKKDEEKGIGSEFSNDFTNIPKLLEKAVSVVRDLDPIVKSYNLE
jgi:hypothetical protein